MPHSYEHKETLLKVENVSFSFGATPILRDLNLEVKNVVRPGKEQGQIVALVGPSGSGKTTLFRLLAGLEPPDSGTIRAGSELQPVRRGTVGVVAQHYPLFAHRTVSGNLQVAGRQVGLSGAKLREKADGLLERFGLAEQGTKYPSQLSGGQRQRVAIAQQFMCSEGFMLMDEPFSGLDLLAQDRVLHFIAEMAANDELATFILVTHDITAALQIADTLWVMGRDRDENGQPIPGARIQAEFNLIERGLAWRENVASLPEFGVVRQEVRELFARL